jgi:phage recombination protein Bet
MAMTETETRVREEVVTEQDAGTRTPLARVVPIDESRVDLFNPKRWSKEDVDVVKKTVCPAGIPDAEFKLFIMKCQASGMNPLLGEAFCIKRNQNIGSKDSPKWIEVFQFTPGEQGMEGRADDFPDYRGLRAAAVYEADKILIDASAGEVSHQYNPVDPKRGRLLGAWGIAYREGRKTPVEFVRLDEYMDARNPKWASSPSTMIVKCARAAALRRAYPNAFDGIFVREEIAEEGERVVPTESVTGSQAEQMNRDTTDKLADRMRATAEAQAGLKDAPRPGARTVDVVAEKPKPSAAPTNLVGIAELKADLKRYEIPYTEESVEKNPGGLQELVNAAKQKSAAVKAAGGVTTSEMDRADKAGPAPVGPLMVFGPKKGQPVASLDGPEILEQIAFGESKIGGLDATKAAKVRACIDDLKAEEKKRTDALLAATEPLEPGSDLDVD